MHLVGITSVILSSVVNWLYALIAELNSDQNLINKWQSCLDKYGIAILMDFSKGSDSLPYEVILAKLYVMERREPSQDYIWSYFQVLKINCTFSSLLQISLKVPQGSIFCAFLFKILFNPFVPNAPFLYPLKTSENLTVV